MTDARSRLDRLVDSVAAPEAHLLHAATLHHDRLTKPRGALGSIEALGGRLSAIAGEVPPPVPERVEVAVFAGDHGVVAEGVTPWPSEVTAQMVANICHGGAAVSVLARRAGARVTVVDVGVASLLDDHPRLRRERIRPGTGNLRVEPAMSPGDAITALLVGADLASELVADGAQLLVTGEMGIGNTTPAAALIAAVTGRPAAAVTGRGTGIDDRMLEVKVAVIDAALARCSTPADPIDLLAEVGGLEIAALAGYCLAAASARVPVVVDGVIALAGALVAVSLQPAVRGYLIAGHRSVEPGATAALEHLGLDPILDLGLRLGEGTGALLAVPTIQAAAAVMAEMATFDSAGVTDKADG